MRAPPCATCAPRIPPDILVLLSPPFIIMDHLVLMQRQIIAGLARGAIRG